MCLGCVVCGFDDVVFVFKQKTAYEMRMSDWSSDVCSSDLQFGIEARCIDEEGNEVPRDGTSSGSLQVRGPWVVQRYYKRDESATDGDGWFDTGDVAKIGRASCRARVCKYV